MDLYTNSFTISRGKYRFRLKKQNHQTKPSKEKYVQQNYLIKQHIDFL